MAEQVIAQEEPSLGLTTTLRKSTSGQRQLLASLGLGVSLFAVGAVISQVAGKDLSSLIPPLILGSVGFLATALFNLRGAYDNAQGEIIAHLHQITDATRLMAQVGACAIDTDHAEDLVRAMGRFDECPGISDRAKDDHARGFVTEFAQRKLVADTDFFNNLANGFAECVGEDREWLLQLTDLSTRSIAATSLAAVDGGLTYDTGFWSSDLGKNYVAAQAEAVRRGAVVRRLFIVKKDLQDDPGLHRVMREQMDRGIEVRVLYQHSKSWEQMETEQLPDMIVFDEAVLYQSQTSTALGDGSRSPVESTRLHFTPTQVERKLLQFDRAWDVAQAPIVKSSLKAPRQRTAGERAPRRRRAASPDV